MNEYERAIELYEKLEIKKTATQEEENEFNALVDMLAWEEFTLMNKHNYEAYIDKMIDLIEEEYKQNQRD